jgi:hypothetical protein
MNDTRDAERVQTQACGRAMGLLGYASGSSLEGDTDEPDPDTNPAPAPLANVAVVPRRRAVARLEEALGDRADEAADWIESKFGDARTPVPEKELDELLRLAREGSPVQMAGEGAEGIDALGAPTTDGGDPVGGPDAGDAVTVPGTGPAAVRAALKEAKP